MKKLPKGYGDGYGDGYGSGFGYGCGYGDYPYNLITKL